MRAGAVTLVVFVLPAIAHAGGWYCSRPFPPSCLTQDYTYSDQWEADRCLNDLKNFRWLTDSYLECLQDYADDAVREAKEEQGDMIAEFDRTVEYWNCMMEQRGYCRRP